VPGVARRIKKTQILKKIQLEEKDLELV